MKGNLKDALKGKLAPQEISQVYKSFDTIGDLIVIRIPEPLLPRSRSIAEALMQQHKHVKSVWRQSSSVSGDFRLRNLEWIAGEKTTETVHKEHGCFFKVDIREAYFSPRLGFERLRIAKLVKERDIVVNMFAGVGCYSIIIAKHSKAAKIYSIDINSMAVKYLRENMLLNKVVDKVVPLEGDAEYIIKNQLTHVADRVLMPLPEKAQMYLDSAIQAMKLQGGWIHYYGFEHASKKEDPIEKEQEKVTEKLRQQDVEFDIAFGRTVRQTGPNWYQIALDIKIQK